MRIRIQGSYASIGDLTWEDVPPLAVISGLNGAGKSQFLELLAASQSAFVYSDYTASYPTEHARVWIDGETFAEGETFYSSGDWRPLRSNAASEDQVREAIREIQPIRKSGRYAAVIAQKLQKPLSDIRLLTAPQFHNVLTPNVLWTYAPEKFHTLSLLFLAYRYLEREAAESGEDYKSARLRLGEEPWILLESIISSAGLPFAFNVPAPLPPSKPPSNVSFEFQLRDRDNSVVPIESLSAGERVLMSTAIWRYDAEVAGRHHRLFLLDEPDAHLHPSLTRRFLNILSRTFVEERGVRVIMTTHSPSTVALAPKGALFEMKRTHPRISTVSRANAVATLTDGFVAVQDATRTVFLEGKTDSPFYAGIWQILTEGSSPAQPPVLSPYPNMHFVYGNGKPTILSLVPQLRRAGFANFYGIIDRDGDRDVADGVFVLDRYSIESYLYDPLNVWFLLSKQGKAPPLTSSQFTAECNPRFLSAQSQQEIINIISLEIEKKYPATSAEATVRAVKYNDKALDYRAWTFTRAKSRLREQFGKVFMQFSATDLMETYFEMRMIPADLIDLYRSLQESERSEDQMAAVPK